MYTKLTFLPLLPFAFVLLALPSCADRKGAVQANDRFGGTAAGDSLFFSMERTPCFGRCPAYRIQVYRSGHAVYEGMSNVEKEGMHQARIGMDTLRALLEEAERIGYFDLADKYDGPVTDLPSTHFRMVSGERDKAIVARYKVPAELKAFGVFVDERLLPVAWKPVPAPQ